MRKKILILLLQSVAVFCTNQDEIIIEQMEGGFFDSYQAAQISNANLVVCWQQSHNEVNVISGTTLYFKILSPDGITLREKTRINDLTSVDPENRVTVMALSGGSFAVAWTNNAGVYGYEDDVYCRIFDSSGEPVLDEFRVNSYISNTQNRQKMAALKNGSFIVCWISLNQEDMTGVYAQVLSADGVKIGDEFRVNSTYYGFQEDQNVVALTNGGFAVAWSGSRPNLADGYDLYTQIFSAEGAKTGVETRAISPAESSFPSLQSITDLAGQRWVAVQRGGNDVFGRVLSYSGEKIGEEIHIGPEYTVEYWPPKVVALNDGRFLIFTSNGRLYGHLCSSLGGKTGDPIPIDSTYAYGGHVESALLSDSKLFIGWNDPGVNAGLMQIHGKIIGLNSLRQAKEFQISSPEDVLNIMDCVDMSVDALKNDRFVVFWLKKDWGFTRGTLCARLFSADTLIDDKTFDAPLLFQLHPNYPNPFNSGTSIRYELSVMANVNISVYNVKGRRIRTLLNESQNAGIQGVQWNGFDASGQPAPSGIYIYRMEARSPDGGRFVKSVKMGLVR